MLRGYRAVRAAAAGTRLPAHPVLTDISFPGSHKALLVELDNETRLLLDLGNGAPFFEPIPLDGPVEVRHGGLAYRFRSDTTDTDGWLQERWLDDAWVPGALSALRPAPADSAAREVAYPRCDTPGQTWVVDSLRLIRCEQDQVGVLRDAQLTRITANGKHVERIAERAAYVRLATDVFGMPRLPIPAALDALADRA